MPAETLSLVIGVLVVGVQHPCVHDIDIVVPAELSNATVLCSHYHASGRSEGELIAVVTNFRNPC